MEQDNKKQEGLNRLPGESDVHFNMRSKRYAQALNCPCDVCKGIVAEYSAAQRIDASQESGWVSVETALPESFKDLYISDGSNVGEGYLTPSMLLDESDNRNFVTPVRGFVVRYWQYKVLPSPPKQ